MAASKESTGRLQSGDVEIFYRRFGSPGRIPLLIVHGLSYFSYDWISPAARWAVDREVVAIDMRGFGQSTWSASRDYKLETIGQDVIAVLDHLGWDKAVLLGHSYGGRVCLGTAGWHPERLAGLILVDFAPDVAALGRRRTAERIGLQPDLFKTIDDALAYHGVSDGPEIDSIRARYQEFMRREDNGYVLLRDLAFRDSFKRTLEAGQSPPVPQYLWPMFAALQVPALVIRGSESDMFAPETMDKVRSTNPHAQVLELAGGHDLVSDNEDGLVKAVQSFFEQNLNMDA